MAHETAKEAEGKKKRAERVLGRRRFEAARLSIHGDPLEEPTALSEGGIPALRKVG